MIKNSDKTWIHPEQRAGEIFLTNIHQEDRIYYKTKRLGYIAYAKVSAAFA